MVAAAGIEFSHLEFSTDSALDFPEFFDSDNMVDFECAGGRSCVASPALTSYRGTSSVARDRRYFVMVVAEDPSGDWRSSPIWVIDDGQPLVPGEEPGGSDVPTNNPVAGHPLSGAMPPPGPGSPGSRTPRPTLSVESPKTVAGVLRNGVRLRLTCPVAGCHAQASLQLAGRALVRRRGDVPRSAGRTLTLRLTGVGRRRLAARRQRATLRLVVTVDAPALTAERFVRVLRVTVPRPKPARSAPSGGSGSGTWSGSNITFRVSGGRVTFVELDYAGDCGAVTVRGTTTSSGSGAPISGSRFRYDNGAGFVVSGRFTGSSTASGSYAVDVRDPVGGSTCALTGAWTARRA